MLISYNWLRELTGSALSPQEMRDRLTGVGLAVDAVETHGHDFVLDVEVPSNRGDCLSHLGIAREIAVIEKSTVRIPQSQIEGPSGKASEFASVEIRDADLCPRYAGRVIRGVKIGPSPEWLTQKLEAIGQRPINNVADITNLVLHEFGQPLHAFDLAKLGGRKIIVRRATKGETVRTLDGVERKLDEHMLVIADLDKSVAVAGVMGGEDSEISGQTTDVLIESAYFDPSSVRRTARVLALHTEASHRFERGTDPSGVIAAQDRCVALICGLAGGIATEDALDVYPNPIKSRAVTLRPERVEAITSLSVPVSEMKRILGALGFELAEEGPALTYNVPSWRHDVSIEEDLVEEVARQTGYDAIASELPPASGAGEYHSSENRKRALRQALAANGYLEAISFSFIESTNDFELIPELGNGEQQVTLTNPIIEEASRMRPTLLPGLLNAVRHNFNQGKRDLSLFEMGRAFAASPGGELPREREALAMVVTGAVVEANRAEPGRTLDFFDFKGALEAGIEAMNLPPLKFLKVSAKHLADGQAASIEINGTRVGTIGRVADALADNYRFRQPVFVAEVDLTSLLEATELPVRYTPLPRYPSIVRDASLLVERRVSVAELISTARGQQVADLIGVTFVGTYEGVGIPDDKRSVTLRFEYRASDHTMRDDEVDAHHWPLIETLKQKFNAEIR